MVELTIKTVVCDSNKQIRERRPAIKVRKEKLGWFLVIVLMEVTWQFLALRYMEGQEGEEFV